jgi:CheY-like chemotaxis protein
LTDEQRRYVDILASSGQTLLRIINDVLDFSKIEAGHLDLETSAFALLEPFTATVNMLAPLAAGKDLKLRLQTDPQLPAAVIGDESRVRQIVTNLVGNAVKFTDTGQVLVDVSLQTASPTTAAIRCEVSDTGIGISAADIPLLFSDFSQIDTSNTRRFGGTGLGLAISDRLVAAMGGQIGCEPNPGGGTTFWFTLSFELPPSLVQTLTPPTAVPDTNSAGKSGPLILIVEDNEINAFILERMLTLLGYRSNVVHSGVEALEAVAVATHSEEYAAVLMDCQMPVMDGYTTTRRLRADPMHAAQLPVIAITATATTEDQERCLAAGMDDYLSKPILPERLAPVLERWAPLRLRRVVES